MKNVVKLVAVLLSCVAMGQAVERGRVTSTSDFTGDNMAFSLVSVGSGTVALALPSTSRGALTCINVSTNTIYLSTGTPATALGAGTLPLPAGQAIEFRNNAALFGVVAGGTAAMSMGCATEW